MSDPLKFTTEAERMQARAKFLRTVEVVYASSRFTCEDAAGMFDRAFPPIAPPKMVPEEWWVFIRPDGKREGPFFDRTSKPTANPGTGYRIARVRVVEVDDA